MPGAELRKGVRVRGSRSVGIELGHDSAGDSTGVVLDACALNLCVGGGVGGGVRIIVTKDDACQVVRFNGLSPCDGVDGLHYQHVSGGGGVEFGELATDGGVRTWLERGADLDDVASYRHLTYRYVQVREEDSTVGSGSTGNSGSNQASI